MRNIFLILSLLAACFLPNRLAAQAVVLKTDTVSIDCKSSDTFLIPVRVRNFTNVGSLQFTLNWNPSVLDYAYTTPLSPAFLQGAVNVGFDSSATNIAFGRVTFTWTRFGGLSVPNDTVLFALAFRRIGGPFSPLAIVGSPVTIEVTDANGNELQVETISGGVRPVDNLPPTIECPQSVVQLASAPSPVNNIAPVSVQDNCAIQGIGWTSAGATVANAPNDPDASGAVFDFGTSTVIYRATDVTGSTATCSFTVTLEFSNTSDTLTLIAQSTAAACGQTLSVNITALNFDSLGSLDFSLGWPTASLQYASVSNLNPALMLAPTNFGTTQTGNGFLAFSWTTSSLTGTTLPNGAVLFTLNFNVVGSNTNNAVLQFGDFPTNREAFTSAVSPPEPTPAVFINGQVSFADLVPPTITCPANATTTAAVGSSNAPVSGLAPTFSDNCGNATLTFSQSGATSGQGSGPANGNYNVGLTTVTYTATDGSSNTATCSFTVLVNNAEGLTLGVDSVMADCQSVGQSVAFNVYANDFQNLIGLQFSLGWDPVVLDFDSVGNRNPGLTLGDADFLNFIGTDAGILRFLSGEPVAPFWPNLPDDAVLFTIYFTVLNANGTTPIEFVPPFDAVDQGFNSVLFNRINGYFSIGDLTPPTISCPDDIEQAADPGTCSANIDLPLPIADDACGTIQEILSSKDTPLFVAGSTTVFYTAFDAAGNSANCSFVVTVTENLPPQIQNCPADISVDADPGGCTATVNWTAPTASDSCNQQGAILATNILPGTVFASGATLVTYTATDLDGNTATCAFIVTVSGGSEPPALNACPADITVEADADACDAIVTWTAPTATGGCGGDGNVTVEADIDPGSSFPVGNTVVTYTATDLGGSTATCSFLVTVTESTPPTLTNCPGTINIILAAGKCDSLVNWAPPTASDACGTASLQTDVDPNTVFPAGSTTVTYTATDESGNTATCAFEVFLRDLVPPVFTACPSNIPPVSTQDPCGAVVNWEFPAATDNCSEVEFETVFEPGDTLPIGTTTIVIRAFDASLNYDTCTFTITVNGPLKRFDNIPAPIVLSGCDSIATWDEPIAVGFCELDTVFSNFAPGDTFPVGVTTVVYTAVDGNGFQTTASFTVTVAAGQPPQFDCPAFVLVNAAGGILADPDDFISDAEATAGCDAAILSFNAPTATDDCGTPIVIQFDGPLSGASFPVGTDTLRFRATDAAGNTALCVFSVEVLPLRALSAEANPNPGCAGNMVVLSVPQIIGATYSWSGPQNFTSNSNQATILQLTPSTAGDYIVSAVVNGCATPPDTVTVLLALQPNAVDDLTFVLDPGQLDTFNILLNDQLQPASDFQVTEISPLSGLTALTDGNVSYQAGQEPGTVSFFYEVCSVSCPTLCDMATVSITIRDAKCSFVPNVFTPNGDNVNDWLEIPCLEGGAFAQNSLVVYNQWGDKVYEAAPYSNDPAKAWRGTLDGEEGKNLPDGVYFYIFSPGPSEATVKGFIEIFR
jgi:gliding motility-associated-like protein